MILNAIYILIDIIFLVIIILSFISIRKNKYNGDKLFETKDFWIYKLMTLMGIVVITFLGLSFIREDLNYNFKYENIAFLLMFFSQWITFPRRIIVDNKGFYYMTRFNGKRLICEFNNIESYKISDKGKIKLYSYDEINIGLIGKIEKQDVDRIKKILNDRKIKSR
ncbi:hypothetical protein TR13x_10510 [Caloranaerobacter sp. TR13]|uniref:hypothetical protein n=1 Tax=Caloranaerobacter sp. TR13 TaxID=1302151 RepID=UPI0006D469DD|nr:hypothetical protein [Caloranaerobacter sp. TR13]KPU26354.1 hypothetical protein TR13x_10510 [Caloranaerobacter sp. TR13]